MIILLPFNRPLKGQAHGLVGETDAQVIEKLTVFVSLRSGKMFSETFSSAAGAKKAVNTFEEKENSIKENMSK